MTLVALVAAWIAGLVIGLEADVPISAIALFSLAALALGGILWHRGLAPWPALLILVTLMGLIRAELSEGEGFLRPSDGLQTVVVRGAVASDPELSSPGVEFRLTVDAVDRGEGWEEDQGKMLVFARPTREMVRSREEPYFRYGDELELTGRLEEPPRLGDFDFGAYLAAQGIHSVMSFPQDIQQIGEGGGNPLLGRVYDIRREVAKGIDTALPEPQASLAQALLLGLRGRLSQDVKDDFRSTGTSHLLAISGLHVGILLALTLGASAWVLGRRRQVYLLLPLGAIWVYALLSGFSPPVERAAIMGSVYLLALAIGRPRSSLPALALAAGVMAGLSPGVLKQVSFQLSFTAVAGIALLSTAGSPWWDALSGAAPEQRGVWSRLIRALVMAVAVSVVATLATLPLITFYFHRIPTVGIPATVLALPALPLLLITSGAAAVVGMIHSGAGEVLGWVAWVPLEYLIRLVQLFAQVPGSTFSVPAFSGVLVWAYYGAFALLILIPQSTGALGSLFRRLTKGRTRWVSVGKSAFGSIPFPASVYIGSAAVLAILAALLWHQAIAGSDERLHVHFLDVGQGDAVLVVTPQGRQVLVDGGPDPIGAARAVGHRLSFWDRDLDLVDLTHPDEDHFRGLAEILDRYRVDVVLESGMDSQNPLYLEWRKAVETEGARRVTATQGQKIELGGSISLEVVNPGPHLMVGTNSDSNNNGVVIRLVYGRVSFLLTADIEAEAEERLLREGLPLQSTVLKVPHHGSRTSTTSGFLAAVAPVVAVTSAGADNPFGHPHAEVTARLESAIGEGRSYLTAEHGDVELITDGRRLWVKTER